VKPKPKPNGNFSGLSLPHAFLEPETNGSQLGRLFVTPGMVDEFAPVGKNTLGGVAIARHAIVREVLQPSFGAADGQATPAAPRFFSA
jgi:hypothetical protein